MSSRTLHVTFVCSGNICRSPMGEVILTQLVEDAGLSERVRVSSSGTGDWHVGEHADPRTIAVLAAHGYDGTAHRAREFDPEEFDDLDLVLASDEGHVRALHRFARTPRQRAKIRLVREFDPAAVEAGTLEMSDPWYGGDDHFARCFREVEAACHGILDHIRTRLEVADERPSSTA
ncbi:protein tyrosine phosphatase [Intrasporangium oryzae NRRL B-24470]|uniref:protein-tyrosine-phosphatase n=1 Tax=Intrasporangium oryzae NRRL B-24470 TaxID=1386089 RepID=W9GA81_9MICO|nr:low molecular weight protein-tyrosine-phosphatase [Intrasporangium oryzae]EWT02132.1 protein tyrosine phosphatase [Intrasporangium oryzae NRRL B-24470]